MTFLKSHRFIAAIMLSMGFTCISITTLLLQWCLLRNNMRSSWHFGRESTLKITVGNSKLLKNQVWSSK